MFYFEFFCVRRFVVVFFFSEINLTIFFKATVRTQSTKTQSQHDYTIGVPELEWNRRSYFDLLNDGSSPDRFGSVD